MKKSLLAFGAMTLMLAVSSCKNDADSSKAAQQPETSTAATEQVAEPAANTAAAAGNAFLQNLKDNDKDVKWLDSGLGYKVIKEGKGDKPTMDNTVNVKYTGKHIDGSVFDSSGDQTVSFPLRGVIPGFSQGIVNMSRGAVYELYIPSDLGYGPTGTPGGPIAPDETLIFEIELVDF